MRSKASRGSSATIGSTASSSVPTVHTGASLPVRSRRRRAHQAKPTGSRAPPRMTSAALPNGESVIRQRDGEPAIVEERDVENADRLARAGQGGDDAEIPEQHEEQQRDVAHRLDVGAGDGGEQPVAREPRDADEEAEHGRGRGGDQRDQHRVDDADPEQRRDCPTAPCSSVSTNGTSMPAVRHRKSKPDAMPASRMLREALTTKKATQAEHAGKHEGLPEDVADLFLVDEGERSSPLSCPRTRCGAKRCIADAGPGCFTLVHAFRNRGPGSATAALHALQSRAGRARSH